MSELERGFRAGVEAAARVVEADPPGGDPEWRTARIADAIRSLASPTPEPATLCAICGAILPSHGRGCVRYAEPAPAPGPERCGECNGERKAHGDHSWCPSCKGTGKPGPERCGHEHYSWEPGTERKCLGCGAVFILGRGWTGGGE